MKTKPMCRVCGVELTSENWFPSCRKYGNYICKTCHNKEGKQWKKDNPVKANAIGTRRSRKAGHKPFYKNKKCPQYLGIHISEHVLSHVFKNVQRMPMHNPGYDFICGRGYKIDVKSACKGKTWGNWGFHINHNTTADYFLCLAFDDRQDLNPMHVWLLVGSAFNHLMNASISQSTIHKWDEYRLDVTKVATCCNMMKEMMMR